MTKINNLDLYNEGENILNSFTSDLDDDAYEYVKERIASNAYEDCWFRDLAVAYFAVIETYGIEEGNNFLPEAEDEGEASNYYSIPELIEEYKDRNWYY